MRFCVFSKSLLYKFPILGGTPCPTPLIITIINETSLGAPCRARDDRLARWAMIGLTGVPIGATSSYVAEALAVMTIRNLSPPFLATKMIPSLLNSNTQVSLVNFEFSWKFKAGRLGVLRVRMKKQL